METQVLQRINLAARFTIAFVLVYHGLVPKIIWLSPTEASLVSAHGFDAATFSPIAGLFEIALGLIILLFRRTLVPIYIASALLVALLIDVALTMPLLLIEAFNPVTINVATIALAYITCVTQPHPP